MNRRSRDGHPGPTWRAAAAADLPAIQGIADATHVDLLERPQVFSEKLRLFPDGCFVLMDPSGIVGYGFSYPWLLRSIPPLDSFLERLPDAPECLFIHDVVVLPPARGRGATSHLIEIFAGVAADRGLARLALVSVYGTRSLWQRLAFRVVDDPALAGKLTSYGDSARYMIRGLR